MRDITIDGTVVVGLGGIGSSAAYHLAAGGERVIGLDPRQPGHRDGSSHGRTRLMRQAYFEDPAYVPLTMRAWQLWHDLEAVSGEQLLTACGVLAVAPSDDPVRLVPRTLEAAHRFGLPVERLDAESIRRRFPTFQVDGDWEGVLEHDAGFVDPEATIRTHHRLATAAGAEFRAETVLDIEFGEEPVVTTTSARYRPRSVIVTTGPWAPGLLAAMGLPIVGRRKVVAHFTPREPAPLGPDSMPGFVISAFGGTYYGFPALPGQGVKIGRHDGGLDATPDSVDRAVHPDEVAELRRVLQAFLPSAAGPDLDAYTCLYTMSPDEDFLLGALPGAPNCFVATGCSGHAFKFVPVIGEILADLTTGRTPPLDLGLLSPARFDPARL